MMDIKLALSLQTMLRSAPDDAKDVVHDIQLHSEQRQRENILIKGREIIAIILQSFRPSDRSDMTFTIEHLIRLEYPGDKNMSVFRNNWYDISLNLRKEDTPRESTLRDILYHKSKGSRKLEFGLNTYARLPDAHPEKTYRFLLGLIERQQACCASGKEEGKGKRRKFREGRRWKHSSTCATQSEGERPRQEGQRKRQREKHEP